MCLRNGLEIGQYSTYPFVLSFAHEERGFARPRRCLHLEEKVWRTSLPGTVQIAAFNENPSEVPRAIIIYKISSLSMPWPSSYLGILGMKFDKITDGTLPVHEAKHCK